MLWDWDVGCAEREPSGRTRPFSKACRTRKRELVFAQMEQSVGGAGVGEAGQ